MKKQVTPRRRPNVLYEIKFENRVLKVLCRDRWGWIEAAIHTGKLRGGDKRSLARALAALAGALEAKRAKRAKACPVAEEAAVAE